MKKSARTPTSEAAIRLATIFHRQLTTKWNLKKEIKPFRELVADGHFQDMQGLAMVERYYRSNWPPRHGKNNLRTDLATLLNNYQGELDRATAWAELHPLKPIPRKIIPLPMLPSEPYVPPSDPAEIERLARFQEQFSAFKKVRESAKEMLDVALRQ